MNEKPQKMMISPIFRKTMNQIVTIILVFAIGVICGLFYYQYKIDGNTTHKQSILQNKDVEIFGNISTNTFLIKNRITGEDIIRLDDSVVLNITKGYDKLKYPTTP